MFVVHTVNQLEEAVRVGAEEILITGGLAKNVHQAYMLKNCEDVVKVSAESSGTKQGPREMGSVTQNLEVPGWMISSLMLITGEYALLDAHLDSRSPSMILQRTAQH